MYKMFLLGVLVFSLQAWAHCEIPCGIYDDHARIHEIEEHIQTIEKSMQSILELSSNKKEKNDNQLVRWVMNKEEHATKIQTLVSQYFLTQRIKSTMTESLYQKQLIQLHSLLVDAMKAKQTTDLAYVKSMRKTLGEFEKTYNTAAAKK